MKLIALVFSFLLLQTNSFAQLSPTESKILNRVESNNSEALDFLKNLVNTNSGTMNFEGVREVGDVLRKEFDDLGLETSWVDGKSFKRAGHSRLNIWDMMLHQISY